MPLVLWVIIILVIVGPGSFYAHRRHGWGGVGGNAGVLILVLLIFLLFGGSHRY